MIIEGDCIDVMKTLPAESVQCCVTSPPYWGLRDYNVDGQYGSEPTIDAFVDNLVNVFREVKRVLRDDGCLFLNLGDNYRDKQLQGQPWRVAFALQSDGWFLRSDIIWAKPNPMPEPATDRPTKSHEYIFLMTKKPRYFYDAEAVREKGEYGYSQKPGMYERLGIDAVRTSYGNSISGGGGTRNSRTVWTIPTQPFSKAHFAVYPEKLVEKCLKAGTSAKGRCPECGTPWVRVVEKDRQPTRPGIDNVNDPTGMANRDAGRHVTDVKTVGWKPVCECYEAYQTSGLCRDQHPYLVEPCVVLDPFSGSGTTGVVAKQLGLDYIGIELNPEYAEMSRKRIANPYPLPTTQDVEGQMELTL